MDRDNPPGGDDERRIIEALLSWHRASGNSAGGSVLNSTFLAFAR